jgi:hypothetical protein
MAASTASVEAVIAIKREATEKLRREVLQAYPGIPQEDYFLLGHFLWGDWLFADSPVLEQLPTTIEDRDFRRDVVLRSIATYNEQCQQLIATNKTLRESVTGIERLFLKAVWELLQLRRLAPEQTLDRITAERKVNEIDPDFSFEQAVQAMLDKDRS